MEKNHTQQKTSENVLYFPALRRNHHQGPKVQRTKGPVDQWTKGRKDQWTTDVKAYFIFGAGAGAFGSKLNIWSPNWSF